LFEAQFSPTLLRRKDLNTQFAAEFSRHRSLQTLRDNGGQRIVVSECFTRVVHPDICVPADVSVLGSAGIASTAGGSYGSERCRRYDGAYAAINQFETCLRCHGTGPGKQRQLVFGYSPMRVVVNAADPLNLIPEFALTSTSSHLAMHDRSSPFPQPSLLTNMLNENGTVSGLGWACGSFLRTAITAMTTGNLEEQA
jgi:hypothetical protein